MKSSADDRVLSKIGLYTSPHLRFVRERIQINGEPLTEAQFAKYFFETWDRLENAAERAGEDPKSPAAKPVYFRFLTLMAFHTYLSEGVDCAIIECGIGGAYDSTNVIQKPAVTGITNLGIDHVGVLGNTLPEIAWHKAGIMKKGAVCYTTSTQLPEAKTILEDVAAKVGTTLKYVDAPPNIASGQLKLGLQADFQKVNASIALEVSKDWLKRFSFDATPDYQNKLDTGLRNVRWGGRCETRQEGKLTWYIDGGHTLESIRLAGQWYASTQETRVKEETEVARIKRFLIFNQQTRDARALTNALHDTLSTTMQNPRPFTDVIFCTNETFRQAGFRPDLMSANTNQSDVEALKVQKDLAEAWKVVDPDAAVTVVKTIEEAVDLVREASGDLSTSALVTGSLHLVGGFLEVLESTKTA